MANFQSKYLKHLRLNYIITSFQYMYNFLFIYLLNKTLNRKVQKQTYDIYLPLIFIAFNVQFILSDLFSNMRKPQLLLSINFKLLVMAFNN